MESRTHEWIRAHAEPTGPIVLVHDEPWARVSRVPVASGVVWFKECAPVQAFEPRLTAQLASRWPGRVADVVAHDEERRWLLLADAGTPVRALGNPPEIWLRALPSYAELQRGEVDHTQDHLDHGVPDLRIEHLPERFEDVLALDLPLEPGEVGRLRAATATLARWCDELAASGSPATIQHDDLHMANLFVDGDRLRVLDWGDASVSHPFFSLVVTFRFLEEVTGFGVDDPWFARLRDAYLEPWGRGLEAISTLAMRLGAFARAAAYPRVRAVVPEAQRASFDVDFAIVLRRAIAAVDA